MLPPSFPASALFLSSPRLQTPNNPLFSQIAASQQIDQSPPEDALAAAVACVLCAGGTPDAAGRRLLEQHDEAAKPAKAALVQAALAALQVWGAMG